MEDATKHQIGQRVREMREKAGYTREKLGELCVLSPRFIANVEFGDSALSLDSLMTVCRVLSCSSDYLLFGDSVNAEAWAETADKLSQLDIAYQPSVNKAVQGIIETIIKAEGKKLFEE